MLENNCAVFVGECKLPQKGNESNRLILRKDIKQVLRKLMAVAEHESKKAGLEPHTVVQMEAAVISTAGQFWESEKDLIASIQRHLNRKCPGVGNRVKSEFPLRFMQARLRQDFMRQKRLRVLGIKTWRTWTISCEHDRQGSVSWRIKTQ